MIERRLLQPTGLSPFFCQWELTCRCNLKCVMCYTDCFNTPEKIRQELSTGEILGIMDELKEAGCAEICMTGGEPMARPDFFRIYEHAKKSGFLVTVFTNGTLLSEEAANRFADLPPSRVEISLHSLKPERFDEITQHKGAFAQLMQGLERLKARRIPLVLKTVALTLNVDEILEIKNFVEGLGAKFLLSTDIFPDLARGLDVKRFEISEEAWRELVGSHPQLEQDAEALACQSPACAGGGLQCHIDAYGQLQLCSGNRRKGYDLRRGSFREGFYEFLPAFPCPRRPGFEKSEAEALGSCWENEAKG